MASKFLCECGYTVCTNSFEGHGIYRLISDNQISSIEKPISPDELSDLWFSSPEIIKCKGCGCFYSWEQDQKEYVQYKKVL